MFDLVHTLSENDIENDFVALASLPNKERILIHSAFIIQYKKKKYVYHYTSVSIRWGEVTSNYFHQRTAKINSAEVPAFIAMCKETMKKANPKYGYFYGGEMYNEKGDHFSETVMEQTMTCVGFCLNILKGFLEDDYLMYTDWDSTSHEEKDYVENYAKDYGLKVSDIIDSHRRISPADFLASSYFKDTPIRKTQTDSKRDNVEQYVKNFQ